MVEPQRPLLGWFASGLLLLGAGLSMAGLLMAMWQSIFDFPHAAWLNGCFETGLGDKLRIVLVVILFVIGLTTATLASIGAWYSWLGYRWTRTWSLVTTGVSLLTLLINPLAASSIVAIGIATGLLWTRPVRVWLETWLQIRRPLKTRQAAASEIYYGPLPRYRSFDVI